MVDEDQRVTHLWWSTSSRRRRSASRRAASLSAASTGRPTAGPSPSITPSIRILRTAARPTFPSSQSRMRPSGRSSPRRAGQPAALVADGRRSRFSSAMAQPFYYYTNSRIAVIPAAGGSITDLTKTFDENPGPIDWLREASSSAPRRRPPRISSSWIPRRRPRRRSRRGRTGSSRASALPRAPCDRVHPHGPKEFPDVWVVSAMTGALKKVTDLGAQVASWPQPSQEVITWKSVDGTPVEGVLHKPATSSPANATPSSS